MNEELNRVGGDEARLRVTATLVRECRRDLLARGIRAEFVPTYLNNYFRTGNGSSIPRDDADADAVNQALNEPIPASEIPDPAAAGRDDDAAARRGPDPRMAIPRDGARAATSAADRTDTPEYARADNMVEQYLSRAPAPRTRDDFLQIRQMIRSLVTPEQLSDRALDTLLTRRFPGVDRGLLGVSTPEAPVPTAPVAATSGVPTGEAPAERPSFFYMGHSFGPGRDADPEAQQALLNFGKLLPAVERRGFNLTGVPIPNQMPSPGPSGDGYTLADSSVGTCSDEGGSGTDRPEGGARASGARPGRRDLKLGYIRCGIRP
ncbi:MAG TPA: hypothetical protein VLJ37_06020 [bacterium]|nr:hypothetical protein [bacterium]